MKKLLSLISSFFFLTGCATIMSGRLQEVSIKTPPAEYASCLLMNDKGEWYVDATPATLEINSSYQDLEVYCEKDGYQVANKAVVSSIKGWTFPSLFFGGILVDGLNGAGFAYPKHIDVEMKHNLVADMEGQKSGF